jgi:hypothetical protein
LKACSRSTGSPSVVLNMLRDLSQLAGAVSLSHVVVLIVALSGVYAVFQRYGNGLHQYPGPFLASITNNWRLYDVWKRDTHYSFRRLHNQYGPVVRVAPNVLSFADPDAITDIYGLNKGYTKVSSRT